MSRPFVDVSLATSRPYKAPRSVEVVQAMGRHDVIRFSNDEKRISSPRWRTGAVARVRFGQAPGRIADLVAYIFEAQPVAAAGSETRARNEVTCIGLTYPLKAKGIESWTEVSTWNLVEEFGNRHRLRTRVDRIGKVHSSVLQKGRSQWRMLADLAQEDGLLFYVADNTIHLRDPRLLEDQERPVARVLALRAGLQKVKTSMGEISDGEHASVADYVAAGVSPVGDPITVSSGTGAYKSRQSRRPFLTEYLDTPMRSIREAQEAVEAADRKGHFAYTAEIECRGDPAIKPGRGVYLDEGVGERASGFWLIMKTTHRVSPRSYTTVAELGRSDSYRTGQGPKVSDSRRVLVSEGADNRSRPSPTEVRRVEGRWVSA